MTPLFPGDFLADGETIALPDVTARRLGMSRKDLIAVVDDDLSFRDALSGLIRSFGFQVLPFDSAAAFLLSPEATSIGCLVLDIHMPGMSGLDLQRRLASAHRRTPIIFMTSALNDKLHARALNDGALVVLEKPCDPHALLKHIKLALQVRD
jgi:FixJ family two-component response regulator